MLLVDESADCTGTKLWLLNTQLELFSLSYMGVTLGERQLNFLEQTEIWSVPMEQDSWNQIVRGNLACLQVAVKGLWPLPWGVSALWWCHQSPNAWMQDPLSRWSLFINNSQESDSLGLVNKPEYQCITLLVKAIFTVIVCSQVHFKTRFWQMRDKGENYWTIWNLDFPRTFVIAVDIAFWDTPFWI